MASDDLLTRVDLERLWGLGKDGCNARIRKYGGKVERIKIGNSNAFAITRAEADRLAQACADSKLAGRQKSGRSRACEDSPRAVIAMPRKAVDRPASSRKKQTNGWHDHGMSPFLIESKYTTVVEVPRKGACEPTIPAIIARYALTERTIRGWIVDGLLTFSRPGIISTESMERIARCYHPLTNRKMLDVELAGYLD